MLLGAGSFSFHAHNQQPLCLAFDVEFCRQPRRPRSVIFSLRSSSLKDNEEEGNNEEEEDKRVLKLLLLLLAVKEKEKKEIPFSLLKK